MPDTTEFLVIEIVGEGQTDIGPTSREVVPVEEPTTGVLTILVHRLCGSPASMRVKKRKYSFLQRGSNDRKVAFQKRQAVYNKSAGLIFVVDTEGVPPLKHRKVLELGRDRGFPDFPTVVGVAHPCIESWLLVDSSAIKKVFGLSAEPVMPECPEDLPDRPFLSKQEVAKLTLGTCAGKLGWIDSEPAWRIAARIKNLETLREKCPLGFAAFADEVEARIKPIFA